MGGQQASSGDEVGLQVLTKVPSHPPDVCEADALQPAGIATRGGRAVPRPRPVLQLGKGAASAHGRSS